MSLKIPQKLEADPIIDAVIEIRLQASKPLSDVLPGVLMQKLGDGVGRIERLPVSSLPKQLRDNDPNLTYQHLVRVELEGYSLFVGDRSITLASIIPYPGGSVFKQKAVEVFDKILELPVIEEITRFSIKYTDFIEGEQLAELAKYLNLKVSVGQKQAKDFKGYNLQFSFPDEETVTLMKVIALANVRIDKELERKGLILEVDTIKSLNELNIAGFRQQLSRLLDMLHLTNKENFFSILTPHALNRLGAI